MPPGTVGHFHGQLVVLAGDGRFEPVLVDQAVRHPQRRQRFHGVGQPVGRLRIAEHDRVKIDGRPSGVDAAVAAARIVVVDLLHLEQPERAGPHEVHHLGENGVALGRLAGLVKRGGRQKHSPRGQPAAGHGPVADGRAGVVQQGHGLLRLPQNEMVLGGQSQQRGVELAAVVRLGPSLPASGQRREDDFAVGQEVIQGPIAKGLFHHAQVGHVVRRR